MRTFVVVIEKQSLMPNDPASRNLGHNYGNMTYNINFVQTEEEQKYTDEPDIEFLQGDFSRCKANLGYYTDKCDESRDLRFGYWPGKNSKTNRKEADDAFPWKGASDQTIGLVDQIVTSDVAMLKKSVKVSNLQCVPTEVSDSKLARLVSQYLRWTLTGMSELDREVGILANNLLMYGTGVLGTYWKTQVERYYQEVSIEEIAQASPEIYEAIASDDPEAKEMAKGGLAQLFPNLKKTKISKILKDFEKTGVASIPMERVVENRPTVRSYEIGREIIFDSNVLNDIQTARAVYCIHYHTPEALRELVLTQKYDEKFVSELIEKAGKMDANDSHHTIGSNQYDTTEQYEGLLRLITVYRRELDDDGVPLISTTIFSEEIEGYAKHELSSWSRGKYPFTSFCRETINHRLLDSRGLAELLRPYEQAIKVEQDARIDRASLSTVPPVTFTVGRKPERIGPGSFVPIRRPGEVQFMDIPQYSPASMDVENELRRTAYRIAGRPTSEEDSVEANIVRQEMIGMWLDSWRNVLKQLWALQRSYAGPEVYFRAVGHEESVQMAMEETAEDYDFELTFDANSLDQEKTLEKLKVAGDVMSSFDRNGQANFSELLRVYLEALDPNLAERLIVPEQQATDKELEETSRDIAKIASGQVVTAPENSNTQLRKQAIQGYLSGTKEIPATDVQQRLQQDEPFKKRFESYMANLEHQDAQRRNALTGKLGAPPGNAPPSNVQ